MKRIFLLLILLLLTGCSCKYDVTLNRDLTVNEEITIYGTDKLYSSYYKTNKSDVLKQNLDNYIEVLEENNYEYQLISDANPYIIIKKKFNNMEEYINNSKFFNDYFDEIRYNKDGNIVNIETIGYNPNEEDNLERFYVESADINIKLMYEVEKSNTKIIDDASNTFKYSLNNYNDDFGIQISYNLNKVFNPHKKSTIIIILAVIVTIFTWMIWYYSDKKKKK